MKPCNLALRIQRPGQGHFCLCAFARQTKTIFVDGKDLICPNRWQGNQASYGCALSHQLAIQTALDSGAQRAVIFEADAEPAQSLSDILVLTQTAMDLLDSCDPRWGAIYLGGYFPMSSEQAPIRDGLVRTNAVMLAHAYVLSPTGQAAAAKVCRQALSGQNLWPYGHIDVAFSTTLHRFCSIYAVEPWLFGQAEHVSELTGKLCKHPVRLSPDIKSPGAKPILLDI